MWFWSSCQTRPDCRSCFCLAVSWEQRPRRVLAHTPVVPLHCHLGPLLDLSSLWSTCGTCCCLNRGLWPVHDVVLQWSVIAGLSLFFISSRGLSRCFHFAFFPNTPNTESIDTVTLSHIQAGQWTHPESHEPAYHVIKHVSERQEGPSSCTRKNSKKRKTAAENQ